MRFSFWLRKWQRSAPAVPRRRQTSVRQRASFRPRLEALEDRVVPSHGHGGGSGGGSGGGLPYATAGTVPQLIADINYANQHGGTITINLKPGTTFDLKSANNTSNGLNGLPVIGGTNAVNLTILGNGDTIERNLSPYYDFRLLDVASGASLTVEDVTLKGGWAGGTGVGADGGAIYNQGTLKVSNSTLTVNNAKDGGVIYNDGGTVTVSNSNFQGGEVKIGFNTEMSSNSAQDSGGGIYNYAGTLTLLNSTLSASSASFGGGIYNDGGTLTLSNSILSDNIATYGAALYNAGGTVAISSNSTLSGNHAEHVSPGYGIPSGPGIGGGVYSSGGTVAISHSILSENAADGYGGGIYNAGSTLTVNNSVFQNNSPDNIDGTYSGSGNTGLP